MRSGGFEIFSLHVDIDLPAQFHLDPAVLSARWKSLQREAHPDRFAAQDSAARRLALQWSVRINEAYARLKDPVLRASYLCALHNEPVRAERNTDLPLDFLTEQMQWREALEDAKTPEEIRQTLLLAKQRSDSLLLKIEHLLDVDTDFKGAADQVSILMFVRRFTAAAEAQLEQFEARAII